MRRVASLSDILNEFGVELSWYLSNWNGQWWWKGYVYIDVDQADDCLYDRILKNWVDDDDKSDDIKRRRGYDSLCWGSCRAYNLLKVEYYCVLEGLIVLLFWCFWRLLLMFSSGHLFGDCRLSLRWLPVTSSVTAISATFSATFSAT